jgi:hypothetical protein
MIAIIAVPVDRRFRAKRMPSADNKFALRRRVDRAGEG